METWWRVLLTGPSATRLLVLPADCCFWYLLPASGLVGQPWCAVQLFLRPGFSVLRLGFAAWGFLRCGLLGCGGMAMAQVFHYGEAWMGGFTFAGDSLRLEVLRTLGTEDGRHVLSDLYCGISSIQCLLLE